MNGRQSRAGGRDNQGRSVNSKRDRTVIQTGSTTINTRTRQPPASKEHMGLWQKSVGAWRPGAGIEGHFLNAHSPVLSASTPVHPKACGSHPELLLSHAQATRMGRKWDLPPTGAAKQHPAPTAQADARKSSCPGTVCNREAGRTGRAERWGGGQSEGDGVGARGRRRDRGSTGGSRGGELVRRGVLTGR